MQQRRSHKKSRRGCLNCKKWHTKCDESGPPCNNCALRNAKCEYAWQKDARSAALVQARKSSSSSGSGSGGEPGDSDGLATKECRRMLELELMHYWSTTTYESLCSGPDDGHYMQFIMPQEALRYDFLLNGIFVSAALHRSTMVPQRQARGYFNVAMELYDKASRSFRKQLAKMNSTNYHVLYIYSSMTAFINIAFSQCNFTEGSELNTFSTVTVAFELLNGSVSIATTDLQRLLDSPVPLRAYLGHGNATNIALPNDTLMALFRLQNLNELYHSSQYTISTPPLSDDLSIVTTPQSDTTVAATQAMGARPWDVAIKLLTLCFKEEQRALLRGYAFIFPGGAGPDFTTAIKASDPMALLIMMHWTVLVERAGLQFWWAKNLGKRLAVGIWKAMQLFSPRSPSMALLTPEWGESLSWVCSQLDIPSFVGA
ncbi:hypothetical protein F4808DRAFT_417203 [Astrocystis sublimbata]|nr:hypothetical protein F4808DRAFT_417203 [Astrocystis sublimbata]